MTKERRLGRGLEALLSQPAIVEPDPTDEQTGGAEAATSSGGLLQLSVYEIDSNPFQPRTEFDDDQIAELADSIREHGIIQPVVVRKVGDRYQLISGERRWRAAIRAGWQEVSAHLREADDREVSELAIVENLQRKDLNALEKAASFQRYLEEFGGTQEELAKRLSIDRSTVANLIRLLELPEEVKQGIHGGKLTAGHARALLPLGDERAQTKFAQQIEAEGLSVRATEELVANATREDESRLSVFTGDGAGSGVSPRSQHLANLEQELKTALGAKVQVRQSAKGRGKIVVHFSSNEEFERLRNHLLGDKESGDSMLG